MKNLIKKIYRFRAKWSLINRYTYLQAVDEIMEEYQTAQILRGGSEEFLSQGRHSLSETQARMKEQQTFIDYLKKI